MLIPFLHNHCGELQRTAFKRSELFQDLLCRCDYAERLVVSFANQIQSEYYVGNRSVSIEGIALEHFSTAPCLLSSDKKMKYCMPWT